MQKRSFPTAPFRFISCPTDIRNPIKTERLLEQPILLSLRMTKHPLGVASRMTQQLQNPKPGGRILSPMILFVQLLLLANTFLFRPPLSSKETFPNTIHPKDFVVIPASSNVFLL